MTGFAPKIGILLAVAVLCGLAGCEDPPAEGAKRVHVEHHAGTEDVRARFTQTFHDGDWVHHGPAEFRDPAGQITHAGSYDHGLEGGLWKVTTEDGMRGEGRFQAGRRHGAWTWYHPDGTPAERGTYAKGVREGTWFHDDEQGRRILEVPWKDGARHGELLEYDGAGNVLRRTRYVDGEIVGAAVDGR